MTQETDENMIDTATDAATHRIDVLTGDGMEIIVAPTAEINPSTDFNSPADARIEALHSDIFRLERARALREVDEATGAPSFEPGSIERFADADGRTMAIVVSFGELCKQAVPASAEGEDHGQE